ncbi:MAG: copper chaperone [Rubrivivax sp.]|nr:MAG: copper chaperone [Rubrivivax sp.]
MTIGSEIHVKVRDLTGPQCVERLTQAIQKLDPSALVQFDLQQGFVDVVTTQPEKAVFMAIEEQGFHWRM